MKVFEKPAVILLLKTFFTLLIFYIQIIQHLRILSVLTDSVTVFITLVDFFLMLSGCAQASWRTVLEVLRRDEVITWPDDDNV